jgi:exosortase
MTDPNPSQPNPAGAERRADARPMRGGEMLIVIAGAILLAIAGAWAYWPTLRYLVSAWETQPDYSHGYLVPPLAVYLLWARRETFPGWSLGVYWPGFVLLLGSIILRLAASTLYLEQIDGWSMLAWIGGLVWMVGGWALFRWSLPSIAFLAFAIPLPYRVERWLSHPLQNVAARFSAWTLQILGQPALVEGNTIVLGGHQLEVAQACSGLRIFVGIFALAFAFVVISRRTWWENLIVLAAAVPVALVANVARIVVTGLLYQLVSVEAAKQFTHDLAGWMMIPFAAVLFVAVLWYLGRVMPEVEQASVGDLLREADQ